jgi:hypothetical protein
MQVGGMGNYLTDNVFEHNSGDHKVGGLLNQGEQATIRGNQILSNTAGSPLNAQAVGLVNYGDHSVITGNLIQGNARIIYEGVAGLHSGGEHTQIYDNVVRDNHGGGISLGGVFGYAPFSNGALVYANVISNNLGHGLTLVSLRDFNPQPIVVQGNLFSQNLQGGIAVYAGTQAMIIGNHIEEHNQTAASAGIFWQSSNSGHIAQNTIISNSLGLVVEGEHPLIRFNDIVAKQVYNVRNDNPFTAERLDVRANWWGMTDIAAIYDTILDGADEAQRGLVDVEPILSTSIARLPKVHLPVMFAP